MSGGGFRSRTADFKMILHDGPRNISTSLTISYVNVHAKYIYMH